MRLAITGASGFLGHHLVTGARHAGHDVLPLVRTVDERAPRGAQALGTLLANGNVQDVDVFVHAAAVRHRHGASEEDYRASNVELVERLLDVLGGSPSVKRFVYVSSVGVHGFSPDLPITEDHPLRPATRYSATKVEAEALVREGAARRNRAFTVVRPTIIYGPGDTNGMLDKMVRMIRAGTYLLVGPGENLLHHTHVDDIVRGTLLACEAAEAANETFILSGPAPITLRRLSELVASALGKRLPPVHVPLPFARGVASVFDLLTQRGIVFDRREPPINHEKLDVMCVPQWFDSGKAQRVLGYRPLVTYEEGVARTVAASLSAPPGSSAS